jgi:hypothetical protein
MARPSIARLHEVLRYDQATGVLYWVQSRGRVKAGAIAGCRRDDGYITLSVDGCQIFAHIVAWAMTHGRWPQGLLDHRNHDTSDNRIKNLRDTTHSINGLNRKGADRDSRTGALGVSPSRGKWKASIAIGGTTKMLGRYETIELASAARKHAMAQISQLQH